MLARPCISAGRDAGRFLAATQEAWICDIQSIALGSDVCELYKPKGYY